jgi:hypothetical protein
MADITKSGSSIVQIQEDQQVLNTQQEHNTGGSVAKPVDGKLVVAEEIQIGHVGSSACSSLLRDREHLDTDFFLSSENVSLCHGRQISIGFLRIFLWWSCFQRNGHHIKDVGVGLLGKTV